MKRSLLMYIAAALMLAGAAGCEDQLKTYSYPVDGLNFVDSLINFSFVYGDPDATRETILLDVETMGYVSDRDRRITLEQVATDGDDAVAGVHYLAFDDASLQDLYVVKKGATTASIPVVLLRDASLETRQVTLRIRIAENEDFGVSLVNRGVAQIDFTDQLIKPHHWNGGSDIYFFGAYGVAKHRWLIETTGEKWDDDYLYNVLGFDADNPYTNDNYDSGYVNGYLIPLLRQKLAAYNEERKIANGSIDDPLMEEDGTIVEF